MLSDLVLHKRQVFFGIIAAAVVVAVAFVWYLKMSVNRGNEIVPMASPPAKKSLNEIKADLTAPDRVSTSTTFKKEIKNLTAPRGGKSPPSDVIKNLNAPSQ